MSNSERDAGMRRLLLSSLWAMQDEKDYYMGEDQQSMPEYSDEEVKEELKRILLGYK